MNKIEKIKQTIQQHHVNTITEQDQIVHLCEGCEYVEYGEKADGQEFNDKKYYHIAEMIEQIN